MYLYRQGHHLIHFQRLLQVQRLLRLVEPSLLRTRCSTATVLFFFIPFYFALHTRGTVTLLRIIFTGPSLLRPHLQRLLRGPDVCRGRLLPHLRRRSIFQGTYVPIKSLKVFKLSLFLRGFR